MDRATDRFKCVKNEHYKQLKEGTKEPEHSAYERSDVCALSAASVVMENVVAFEVARVFREKFGGDSMHSVRANYEAYEEMARGLPLEREGPMPPEMEADQSES